MSRTDVVVFDLGGVIARWMPDRRLRHLAEVSGLPEATIDQLVFASGFDDAGERGRFDLDAFTTELARLLGIEPTADATGALRRAWASAYEPNRALLRALARVPLRQALFTNNGPLLDAALDHELATVGNAFDQRLCSWRLGATKPQPEAFAAVVSALGVPAQRLLFFDDSEPNVDAARAAGWQAHRFTTVLEAQAVLAEHAR